MAASERHELTETLARIERNQEAFGIVARRILETLEIHSEMHKAVLEACTVEPGPSPIVEALKQVLAALGAQTTLLRELPDAISAAVRDELDRDEFTEEMPGADPE